MAAPRCIWPVAGPPSGPLFPFCSPRFLIKLPNTEKGALSIPKLLGILGEGCHWDVAHLLVEAGARVDKADNTGTTPLILACHSGHLEVVRLLLEAKAVADGADSGGITPLKLGC